MEPHPYRLVVDVRLKSKNLRADKRFRFDLLRPGDYDSVSRQQRNLCKLL